MNGGVSQQESSLFEVAVLAALGIVCSCAAIIYLGSNLAAFLFGSGDFHTTFSDCMTAGVHLVRDPLHPAAAWPERAGGQLPGPVSFWTCMFVTTALVGGAFYFAISFAMNRANGTHKRLGVKPHAGFAQSSDLKTLTVRKPTVGRITLGTSGRRLLATETQASLAVIGPTGCGKTAGFAIPALLEWRGPVIATSVKEDLLSATVEHRRRCGKVWIFDPTHCTSHESAQWSPLASCKTWAGAMQTAAWLCEAAQPKIDSVSDGDYWYTQARKTLAPYLFAAAFAERRMSDVVAWIDRQDRDDVERILRQATSLETEIDEAVDSPDGERRRDLISTSVRKQIVQQVSQHLKGTPGPNAKYGYEPFDNWPPILQAQVDEQTSARVESTLRLEAEQDLYSKSDLVDRLAPLVAAESTWVKDSKLRDSIFATVENVLAGYADPSVKSSTQSCEIDFVDWLNGDNTIYVIASSHEQARLRPVLTVLIQQALRAAFDNATRNGGTLPLPCLSLLDEAGNTAPLRDLPAYASTARSHGISLVTIWQDMAQIKAIYRDRSQTVLNNHRAKLFGTGIADEATLEYVSRLIGDVTHTDQNHSRDLDGNRRSVSEHTAMRRAAPVDLLRRIRTNEAVLLYGSELPAHVRLRPWFASASLRLIASAGNSIRHAHPIGQPPFARHD